MLTYILEVTLCWAIFYIIFFAVLRKVTFYRVNRWYLLTALLLGVAIPLLRHLEVDVYQRDIAEIVPLVYVIKDAPAQIAISVIEQTTNWNGVISNLLWGIYLIGFSLFAFRFFKGLFTIRQLYQSGMRSEQSSYTLIETDENHLPFSFLNCIFISSTLELKEDIKDILQHELAHVESRHSIDVLIHEMINIIFWFHPLVYLYKTALRQTHEYLADAVVLENTPRKIYGQILLKQSLSGIQVALAHSFFHSHIKKRINMMYQKKSGQSAWLKYSLALPVLFILFIVFSGYNKSAGYNTGILIENMGLGSPSSIHSISRSPIAFTTKSTQHIPHICDIHSLSDNLKKVLENYDIEKSPLFFIDGTMVSSRNKILSELSTGFYAEEVTILVPEYAMKLYGEKGKYGIIKLLRPKSLRDLIADKRYLDISNYDLKKGHLTVKVNEKHLIENTHYIIDSDRGILTIFDNNSLAEGNSVDVIYSAHNKEKNSTQQYSKSPNLDNCHVTKDGYAIFDNHKSFNLAGCPFGDEREACISQKIQTLINEARSFPIAAKKEGFLGSTWFQLHIDEEGQIIGFENAMKKEEYRFGLQDEAVNVVEHLKTHLTFSPSKCMGKTYKTKYVISIPHKLSTDDLQLVDIKNKNNVTNPNQNAYILGLNSQGNLSYGYSSNLNTPLSIKLYNPHNELIHSNEIKMFYKSHRSNIQLEKLINGRYKIVVVQDGLEVSEIFDANIFQQ